MSRAPVCLPFAALALALASVACGGDSGGAADPDGAIDARGPADARSDAMVDAVPPDAPDLAASLSGLRWELPCLVEVNDYLCDTEAIEVTAVLGGMPGTTYDVGLRFRGVVEQKTYMEGTGDGYWYVGGVPLDEPYNVYKMVISDPPQTYYLNSGVSGNGYCDPIDYTRTVQGTAGATVTLTADPTDITQIKNIMDGSLSPWVVADIPPAPLAYNGQFVQMDVVSVTALP